MSLDLSWFFRRMPFSLVCGKAVNDVHHEMETVQVIQDGHVEGRGDRALFLITADMKVVVVVAAVGQPVDQPRVGV